jgi:Pectate lyase superfamily protein
MLMSGRRLLLLLGMLCLSDVCPAEIIPADRRIDWRAGIPGGIPIRTEVFANIKEPPFNAKGDGLGDDTIAIQSAIDACPSNQVIFLPAGVYKITNAIRLWRSGLTLRGEGPSRTQIRYQGPSGLVLNVQTGGYLDDFSRSTPYDLTGNYYKGSTNVITATNNWNPGDIVLFDQLNDESYLVFGRGDSGLCSWCSRLSGSRASGQLVEMASATSSNAVFDQPLYRSCTNSLSPQGILVTGVLRWTGVEDLCVTNATSTFDTVWLHGAAYCWFKNVRMDRSHRRHLWMAADYRCEVRECVFQFGEGSLWTPTYGPDRAYGVFLGNFSTACLIENNAFYTLHVSLALEGGPSGNVIAYNFVTNVIFNNPEWTQPALAQHAAHPMMNLIEGNHFASRIISDYTWGSASHNTYFRNRVYDGLRPQINYGIWEMDIFKTHYYENVVGNVFGRAGFERIYETENKNFNLYGDRGIYRLGYVNGGDDNPEGNDPKVKATLLRHGNWDSVSQSVIWSPNIADTNLPPSLYLMNKPAWWGDLAWPPYGGDRTPMIGVIPAEARLLSALGAIKRPSPPQNPRIIIHGEGVN